LIPWAFPCMKANHHEVLLVPVAANNNSMFKLQIWLSTNWLMNVPIF
jgi:hypothetical protein